MTDSRDVGRKIQDKPGVCCILGNKEVLKKKMGGCQKVTGAKLNLPIAEQR